MLIVFAAVIVVSLIRTARRRRLDRQDREISDALIEAIDLLLATLRAGYSVHQSLMMLAEIGPHPTRSAFAAMRSAVDSGTSLPQALNAVRNDLGPAFRPLIGLMVSSLRLGIPTESLIESLRSEARHTQRQRGEMSARELSVRAVLPLVLCTLPSFIFLIIVPTVAGTLTHLQPNGDVP